MTGSAGGTSISFIVSILRIDQRDAALEGWLVTLVQADLMAAGAVALAWLGAALGVQAVPLGVDRFGQVGSQPAVYDAYDLSSEAIATAALVALEP